ncbi:hypothetical protein QBC34DRAFT_441172 [Podospora aff. communis PSN243]|uniref:Uncharacterized protein n=1 Tax=Podospora aff. communis PSN243 TaxID=3040156 RepID=A0AAV9GE94_9PEZI|nr:hypothetical protein QBC34DRAFT_441172 [Podospora aff. communis PSN243]
MLHWLERDLPHFYLCDRCQYLHRWRTSDTSVVSKGHCKGHIQRRGAISESLFAPDFLWELTPFQIRLAINRHVYGRLHGPSLRILQGSRWISAHSFGAIRRQSWSAGIINDNLTLHSTTIPITARSRHFSIPELTRDNETGPMFRPIAGSVRSCRVCCTDYQINITQKQECFTVQITKWQKLASCHSAYGLEWKKVLERWGLWSMPNDPYRDETQASVWRSTTHAADQIREEWNRRDAVRSGEVIEGTFVG